MMPFGVMFAGGRMKNGKTLFIGLRFMLLLLFFFPCF